MRILNTASSIGLLLLIAPILRAQSLEITDFEQRFSQMESAQAPQPTAITQAQLLVPSQPQGQQFPPPTQQPQLQPPIQQMQPQPLPLPSSTTTPVVPTAAPTPSYLAEPQCEVIPPDVVFKESPYRTPSWFVDFDLIPTASQFTESEFGDWTDSSNLALRLTLGFEDDTGVGTRINFWGFGQDVSTPATDVELSASTFYWDLYRRLYIEDAELVFGGGPAAAHTEFDFPDIDERSRLNAAGGSVFGEGFFPIVHFKKTDIATIFRARLAVLHGEWRDSGTPFLPDTDHDSLTLTEVAWGFELRRRFGRLEDKYWSLRFMPEYQRWDSAWLGEFADSNLAFVGVNISFGLSW